MIVPSKRLCDLCKNEIPPATRYPTLQYPLDQADMALLFPEKGTAHDVFPGLSVPWPKADTFNFEFCRPCIDAILPMLAELKTETLQRMVAARDASRAREEV